MMGSLFFLFIDLYAKVRFIISRAILFFFLSSFFSLYVQ